MSSLENLVYSAYELGKREALFDEIKRVKLENPKLSLEETYELAYQRIMKT